MKKLLLIGLMFFFHACGGGEGDDSTSVSLSSLQVVSHTPLESQTKVSEDLSTISISFDRDLNTSTVIDTNVKLSNNIAFDLSASQKTITLNLQGSLQRGTNYTLSLENIKSLDGLSLKGMYSFDFRTCEQNSNATYKLEWDEVVDSDLKNYKLYYGKSEPLSVSNAMGSIETAAASYEFTPSNYGVLPCETFYVSVSSIGKVKAESSLATVLSAEAE